MPLSHEEITLYLEQSLSKLCQVLPNMELYKEALKLTERWGYTYYDSLIIAAALQEKCQILYSEDFQHGQTIGDLTIVNPFIPGS
ncbi:MAG: PIN domain-containing protein [Magnetococcales bacterium]|nr:PIN domain-containing protein [Magnetococcales bacterium]